jgi:hypothetical protein
MGILMRSLSVAVMMAAGHSATPPASAQVGPDSPGISTPAPQITDQKLDAAAAAIAQVATLQQTYRQRVAEAPAPSEKKRIVAEANDAMTKAVTDQGLSVDEYASIIELAQNDAALRGKILERMRPSKDDPR